MGVLTLDQAHQVVVGAGDDVTLLAVAVDRLLEDLAGQDDWGEAGALLVRTLDVDAGHPERRRRLELLRRLPLARAAEVLERISGDDQDPDCWYVRSLLGWAMAAPQAAPPPVYGAPMSPPAALPPPPASAAPPRPVARSRRFTWPWRRRTESVPAPPSPQLEPTATEALREAHPLIACNPVWVTDDRPEMVTIGLTPKVLSAVGSTGAIVGTDEAEVVDLTVTVLVDPDSITLAGPDRTFPLPVTAEERFPTVDLTMTARSGAGLSRERRIGLHFRRGGHSVGFAWRRIVAVDTEAEVATTPAPAAPPDLLDLTALTDAQPPDLVLAIYRGDDEEGRSFVWDAFATLDGLDVADVERSSGIEPGDAADFATQTRRTISGQLTGVPLLAQMEGYGVDIARAMPTGVVDALRDLVAASGDTAPAVLLLTEEASVPWELAVLRDPPLASPHATSPFLGAHVAVSRWPLVSGRPRPVPRHQHHIGAAAVLGARYDAVADWPRLPHAEAEAAAVAERYAALEVPPVWADVRSCLEGSPPADWVHVAMHGQFDAQGDEDGLVLLQGEPGNLVRQFMTTRQMQSFELSRRPFVFLNACQVGTGKRVLGGYNGMAVALLRGGATAVVAAQWNIDDSVASGVTEQVYAEVFADPPVPVAEALRRLRAGYTEEAVAADPAAVTPTLLAYQLFGHPRLTLTRETQEV